MLSGLIPCYIRLIVYDNFIEIKTGYSFMNYLHWNLNQSTWESILYRVSYETQLDLHQT